jgi:formiminoglutamase
VSDLVPHGVEAPRTAEDDPRLGRWLAVQGEGVNARVAIVGFPSDEGVRRNGGRQGAVEGPRVIREALYRLTPDARASHAFVSLLERTVDLGDVRVSGDVEEDQARLARVMCPLLQGGTLVVVLGGGHETSYGHFLGYVGADISIQILNWDAHADVRPLVEGLGHSGSPFRQALEHASGRCQRYDVAGLQPHSTARSHVGYVRDRGGRIVWRHDVGHGAVHQLLAGADGPVLASFDLDAVDAAAAPGVSAPNVGGLSDEVWLEAAYVMGRSVVVRSMDVVELNPRFDVDGRTARLAALTVWHFLRGVAARPG